MQATTALATPYEREKVHDKRRVSFSVSWLRGRVDSITGDGRKEGEMPEVWTATGRSGSVCLDIDPIFGPAARRLAGASQRATPATGREACSRPSTDAIRPGGAAICCAGRASPAGWIATAGSIADCCDTHPNARCRCGPRSISTAEANFRQRCYRGY